MKIKHLLGNFLRDTIDSVSIFKGHRREIRKFKSPKRKAIYNTVTPVSYTHLTLPTRSTV